MVEEHIVLTVGEEFAKGHSIGQICRTLKDRGYQPRGKEWNKATIFNIIRQNKFKEDK